MLGWFFSVYTPVSKKLPEFKSKTAKRPLIRWSTGLGGLEWIDNLCKSDPEEAKFLGGDGYPYKYRVTARLARPIFLEDSTLYGPAFKNVEELPECGGEGMRNKGDIELLCDSDWLVVEVFDQS